MKPKKTVNIDPSVRDAAEIYDDRNSYADVADKISGLVLSRTRKGWIVGFVIAVMLLGVLKYSLYRLFNDGIGIWGINVPVGWGFAIINFVWWVGIGHAGTFISAILLLLHQKWRTSINRFAEAMTLFAVACAGLFPLLHVGRPDRAYWLFPYPNTMEIWPQFRSPLLWDVFAVTTYATVSFLFWFVGLIPDLACMRDRAKNQVVKTIYAVISLGWRGSARHWERYEKAYKVLAGLAAPLVISVHTIVGFDFAVSVIPGWHATIFPPYFVAGAIFSGFAMVVTLSIPIRKIYHLEGFITDKHMDNMAKVMLVTGMIVAYGYGMEAFMGWYSASQYEGFMIWNRMTGPYAPYYWALIACNAIIPQLLWSPKLRKNMVVLFIISIVVNTGMWLERFIIVVTSLHRDYLPSSWGMYTPTVWDWTTYLGSIGLFLFLTLMFIRIMPIIAISELQHLAHERAHNRIDHDQESI